MRVDFLYMSLERFENFRLGNWVVARNKRKREEKGHPKDSAVKPNHGMHGLAIRLIWGVIFLDFVILEQQEKVKPK